MNLEKKIVVASAITVLAVGVGLGLSNRGQERKLTTGQWESVDGSDPESDCSQLQVCGSKDSWIKFGIEIEGEKECGVIDYCQGSQQELEKETGLIVLSAPAIKSKRGQKPKAKVWTKDDTEVPFTCACRPTSDDKGDCKQLANKKKGKGKDWRPANFNQVLQAGSWSGDCVKVQCVQIAGWPDVLDPSCRQSTGSD